MDSSDAQCAVVPALEEWRAVPGYEGRYEVSDQGRVRSLITDRVLTPLRRAGRSRYLCVDLYAASKTQQRRSQCVHSLVLLAFVGDRPDGFVADHIDRNILNNSLSNLRYATRGENARNSAMRKRGGVSQCQYRGVSVRKNRFQAKITANCTEIYIGFYKTAIEAARAYDAMARELHGSFAILNFPEVAK